jgi:hypothetical protein
LTDDDIQHSGNETERWGAIIVLPGPVLLSHGSVVSEKGAVKRELRISVCSELNYGVVTSHVIQQSEQPWIELPIQMRI